jgi:hypothetical protein
LLNRQNILNKISRILGEDISKILFEEQLTPLIQDKTYLIRVPCTVLQAIVGLLHFSVTKTFLLNIKSLFLRWQCVHPGGGIRWLISKKSLRN